MWARPSSSRSAVIFSTSSSTSSRRFWKASIESPSTSARLSASVRSHVSVCSAASRACTRDAMSDSTEAISSLRCSMRPSRQRTCAHVRCQPLGVYLPCCVEVKEPVQLALRLCEPSLEGAVALLQLGMIVLTRPALPHALEDLSGVRKERPHVCPHQALKPAGGDVKCAVGGSTPIPVRAVRDAAVIRILLVPARGSAPRTRETATPAADEARQEVLPPVLAKLPGRALVPGELRLRLLSKARRDYGRDRTLDDFLGACLALDADSVDARIGRLVDNIPHGRGGPQSRTPALLVTPEAVARRGYALIVEALELGVERSSVCDVGDNFAHDTGFVLYDHE